MQVKNSENKKLLKIYDSLFKMSSLVFPII